MSKLFAISLFCLTFSQIALGQRVNFKTFVQDETITVNLVENPTGLGFNNKQPVIVAGDPSVVTVNLSDMAVVVVEIEAPLEYDLTLEFSGLDRLSLGGVDTGVTVPFNLNFAYNNTGETSDMARRAAAVQVPSTFRTFTLPVRRRNSLGGAPAPPPTPEHGGFTRLRAKTYVYIYGSLGPAPANARAGLYSTNLSLHINYSDNAF